MQQLPISEHRTQIYLPKSLYWMVQKKAKQHKMSIAAVIRDSLHKTLHSTAYTHLSDKMPVDLMDLAGSIPKGPSDFSTNISKYIKAIYQEKLS